jgi:tyrosine aminotransferase
MCAVPRPGFPLYQVIAESHGASVMQYDLLPDNGWECDLDQMERLLLASSSFSSGRRNGSGHRRRYDGDEDARYKHMSSVCENENDCNDQIDEGGRPTRRREVRGILVNNPSNPTGAVYSREHLSRIVALAERFRLPIIADEIYGDLTFGDRPFHPMADVAASMGYEVPIVTASGLGKQCEYDMAKSLASFCSLFWAACVSVYAMQIGLLMSAFFIAPRVEVDLVPGWRLGWVVFQDNWHGAIKEVKSGARRLAQVVLGACHLAQLAIPAVLDPVDESDRASTALWKKNLHSTIEKQATLLCGLLNDCHGLNVIFPEGGEPVLPRCYRYHIIHPSFESL